MRESDILGMPIRVEYAKPSVWFLWSPPTFSLEQMISCLNIKIHTTQKDARQVLIEIR